MENWIKDLLFTAGILGLIIFYIIFIDNKINRLLKWIDNKIGFKK